MSSPVGMIIPNILGTYNHQPDIMFIHETLAWSVIHIHMTPSSDQAADRHGEHQTHVLNKKGLATYKVLATPNDVCCIVNPYAY